MLMGNIIHRSLSVFYQY